MDERERRDAKRSGAEQIPREDSALTDTPTDPSDSGVPAGESREDRDREKEAAEPEEDGAMR